jgi:hypothetical protein
MKIQQRKWTIDDGWELSRNDADISSNCLVLVFGAREQIENCYEEISQFYPNSDIIINSTSGEIIGSKVLDDSIVLTAIQFEKTKYKIATININECPDSFDAGRQLSEKLTGDKLKHVLVISDGGLVNGSELVKGLNEYLESSVIVTGGLAGDAARFEKTLVGYNQNPTVGNIVTVGLYGDSYYIGYGSVGGWDSFGPKRLVTKSDANVLYELDGQSALELYKRYLGDKAKELPGSALLFPLSIQLEESSKSLVRTILSIDEDSQSMIFAGDIPEGATVRLMKANFDKLIDGAFEAAESGYKVWNGTPPDLAILISCVGRKLVLDQRIEEEIESVHEVIGEAIPTIGFYSYGEISPFAGYLNCELHNQTMTITLIGEV